MKTEQQLLDEFLNIRHKYDECLHDDPYFRQLVSESIGFNSYVAHYRMGIAMTPVKNRLQKFFDVIINKLQSWV